jgi:cytochrome c oxidase subunit II
VTADEDYIRRSIVDPNVDIVEGFPSIMPTTFRALLKEDELDALVEFIKSLQ